MSSATRFVVITMPRSGSTYLRNVLTSHPEIRCFGELMRTAKPAYQHKYRSIGRFLEEYVSSRDKSKPFFNKDFRTTIMNILKHRQKGVYTVLRNIDKKYSKKEVRSKQPYEYLEAVYELSSDDVKGFTLHLSQDNELLKDLVKNPDYKKIVLLRDNQLARYSSWRTAVLTFAHTARKNEKVNRKKIKFEPDHFKQFLKGAGKKLDFLEQTLKDAKGDVLQLEYNQLQDENTIKDIFQFLNVGHHPDFYSKTAKRNSSNIAERFSNPDIVVETLASIDKAQWQNETKPETQG